MYVVLIFTTRFIILQKYVVDKRYICLNEIVWISK